MEPSTTVEQHQDENNNQIAYEASSIDESYMRLLEILKQDSKINKDMNLSPKELTIAYLKISYIDGKYFAAEEISNFLGVSQEEIITTTKKYTNNIYFLGLLPVDITIRKNYQESNILFIDSLIQDISQKENINYLKMKNVIELTDLSDGLHPNNIGHEKICQYIYKNIILK